MGALILDDLAELDALAPDVLRSLFEEAVAEYGDVSAFEHVAAHGIPTEPCKPVTRAGKEIALPCAWAPGDPTAQAEALPPDILLAAIRETVMAHLDVDGLAETIALEADQREELLAELGAE